MRFDVRHAVSFAIVCFLTAYPSSAIGTQGWYLVAPPADRMPRGLHTNLKRGPRSWPEVAARLMQDVPRAKWVMWGSFDSAKECEAARDRRQQEGRKERDRLNKDEAGRKPSASSDSRSRKRRSSI